MAEFAAREAARRIVLRLMGGVGSATEHLD
jgi:hypothetical protein